MPEEDNRVSEGHQEAEQTGTITGTTISPMPSFFLSGCNTAMTSKIGSDSIQKIGGKGPAGLCRAHPPADRPGIPTGRVYPRMAPTYGRDGFVAVVARHHPNRNGCLGVIPALRFAHSASSCEARQKRDKQPARDSIGGGSVFNFLS